MHSINLDFKKIIYYKENNFKIKNLKLLKNIVIKYYVKKNISSNKKKLKHDFYKLFKEFENMTAILPKIYKINLKYTNKKKKIKTKTFNKIILKINKEIFYIFDFFFVKHFFLYISSLEKLKLKKFMYLQEIIKNKVSFKIKINSNFLIFNILVLKNIFNFGKKIFKNKIKFFKNKKKSKKIKAVYLKLKLKSNYILFFFKFVAFLILNNYKINLFFYKKFLDKKDL